MILPILYLYIVAQTFGQGLRFLLFYWNIKEFKIYRCVNYSRNDLVNMPGSGNGTI
jgi:hypothetical protein